jgi:hypothetical protein
MSYIKYLILFPAVLAVLFYGCESNDVASSSVCVTLPVNKKGLVEFFTNAGCVPCIDAHHYFDQVTAGLYDTSLILITYHTKYPYIFDSLYRANIPQNQGRSDYYGVSSTPQGRLDGTSMGQFAADNWSCQINQEFYITPYLNISLSNVFDPNTDSGTVTANITLLNSLPASDNVIHIIITENNITYVTAPNGITDLNDVMRTMVTGKDGEAVTIGQNTLFSKCYAINQKWKEDDCYLTVFIQNPATKQVFGVERIKVKL